MKIRKIIPPKGWNCKISVNKCDMDGRKLPKSIHGHAHNCTNKDNKKYFGLICIKNLKTLGTYEKTINTNGSFTLKVIKAGHYLKHEYAHILTPPNKNHCREWLMNLKKLGGQVKGYINKNGAVRGYKKKEE